MLQHVTMQVAVQTVVMLIVSQIVRELDAHLIATKAAHIIAWKKVVGLLVQVLIVKEIAQRLVTLVVK